MTEGREVSTHNHHPSKLVRKKWQSERVCDLYEVSANMSVCDKNVNISNSKYLAEARASLLKKKMMPYI